MPSRLSRAPVISPLTSHPKLILVPLPSCPNSWSHGLPSGPQRKLLSWHSHLCTGCSPVWTTHPSPLACEHPACLCNSPSCFRSQQKGHFALQSFWCPSLNEAAQIIFSGQTAFFCYNYVHMLSHFSRVPLCATP